jgi:hypothetical protein
MIKIRIPIAIGMKLKDSLYILAAILFLSGCDIINPAEPVPGYIKIEKFIITPTPSLGTDSNKITDVFAYIDTKFQGSYLLPAQFPVIENGVHEMLFFAGITVNGISNTRSNYPFYVAYAQTVNLEPGKVTSVYPVVKYADNVVGLWLESFQGPGLSLVKASGYNVDIVKLTAGDLNNYEGISGGVYLNSSQVQFKLYTDTSYVLPKSNAAVYLEMNYKCNNTFGVGLVAVTSATTYEIPVILLNAKPEWNKIYIELGSVVKIYPDAYYFKVYFEGFKNEGVSNAEFYFDNFKLLHN